jgi:pumilio family protein 6
MKLFRRRTKPEESEACIEKLLGLVTGKLAKIVYKHDACRIVQCLISLKRENIRDRLFDELTPEIVRMAKDRYANFFVRKMLKYGYRKLFIHGNSIN